MPASDMINGGSIYDFDDEAVSVYKRYWTGRIKAL